MIDSCPWINLWREMVNDCPKVTKTRLIYYRSCWLTRITEWRVTQMKYSMFSSHRTWHLLTSWRDGLLHLSSHHRLLNALKLLIKKKLETVTLKKRRDGFPLIAAKAEPTIKNYWTRLTKISWFISGELINYLPKLLTDLPDTDNSRYFAISEFNNCFSTRSPSLFFNE